MIRSAWIALGSVSLGLGVLGLFLPILPTVPFLILTAFAYSRSSERLHRWLVEHPRLGGPIRDWNERGAIGRRAKIYATLSILASPVATWALGFDPAVIAVQILALAGVLVFIWTRPEG